MSKPTIKELEQQDMKEMMEEYQQSVKEEAKNKSAPGIKRQLSDQSKLFDNVFNKGDPDNVAQRLVDRETTFSQEVEEIKKKANNKGGRRTRRRRRKRRKRRSRRGGNPTLEECKKAFPNMIWRGKKPRPRVAPPRIQKEKMNPQLAKEMLEKYRNKPYELNKQYSDNDGVGSAIDDAFSPEREDTANKLRRLREGKKGKRRGGKKKRKRTKKKKRRRRKRTKKKKR